MDSGALTSRLARKGDRTGVEEILLERSVFRHGSSQAWSQPLDHCLLGLRTGLLPT